MKANPYEKPLVPRHSFELLRWVVFEPGRVEDYEKSLSKKEQLIVFLRAYLVFALLFILFLVATNACLTWFDLPGMFLKHFKEDFQAGWMAVEGFASRFLFLLKEKWVYLAVGLTAGLVYGLVAGLMRSLAFGLTGGLTLGLTGGLALGLAGGLALSLALGA